MSELKSHPECAVCKAKAARSEQRLRFIDCYFMGPAVTLMMGYLAATIAVHGLAVGGIARYFLCGVALGFAALAVFAGWVAWKAWRGESIWLRWQ